MHFAFSDQQTEFRDTVRQVLAKECTPDDLRAAFEHPSPRTPRWDILVELGVVGTHRPRGPWRTRSGAARSRPPPRGGRSGLPARAVTRDHWGRCTVARRPGAVGRFRRGHRGWLLVGRHRRGGSDCHRRRRGTELLRSLARRAGGHCRGRRGRPPGPVHVGRRRPRAPRGRRRGGDRALRAFSGPHPQDGDPPLDPHRRNPRSGRPGRGRRARSHIRPSRRGHRCRAHRPGRPDDLHGGELRQGTPPVRPAHRELPGGQASSGRSPGRVWSSPVPWSTAPPGPSTGRSRDRHREPRRPAPRPRQRPSPPMPPPKRPGCPSRSTGPSGTPGSATSIST